MHGSARSLPVGSAAGGGLPTRSAHLVLVAVMTAIVLAGFWPYYAALPGGGPGAHWVVHLHAAVFSAWMLLLWIQVILVFRRRVRTHQQVGRIGIWGGVLLLLLGLAVTFVATADHVSAGRIGLDEGAGFLILPLGDLLLFGGFFGTGIAWRRRKEMHRPLMVLAAVALLFPPAARFAGDSGPAAMLGVWLLPLALATAHEAVTRRRLPRVYLAGFAICLVAAGRVALMESEGWLRVGRALLRPFIAG